MKRNRCIDCDKIIYKTSKRCLSCWAKKRHKMGNLNNKGKNNGRYKIGKYLSNKKCIECGRHCSPGANRCYKCEDKYHALIISGKNNPQYIHGKGNLPYPKEFYKIRNKIRQRDNYTCQLCYKKGKHVHHINYDKKNCKKNNLITLCNECNIRVNANRNYWYAYFKYIMENYIYD